MKVIHTLIAIAVTSALMSSNVIAQEDNYLEPAAKTATEINKSAAKSQTKINSITDQIDDKLQQFKTIIKEIEGLEVYNQQLRRQIENQEQEMLNLNSSIDEVSVIERQITPLMLRMIDGLAQFVELDVPFLEEERATRILELQNMMDRADVTSSEKFRRVMEAFQVEMDYGKTIEAYPGLKEIEGNERSVDFLRIGRTALVYQTRDASAQGVWNKQTRQWEELDASYKNQIAKGLKIAKKQQAPDLLMVPVAITD
jgi:vacuolar-type H+-ATPase subunit I/STV1